MTSWWRHHCVFLNLFVNLSKTTCSIETLQADSPSNVLQNMQIWKSCDQKWRHNGVITKNNRKQWKNADLGGTKQNIYRWKGLMRAIQKCYFYWIWATVSKVMGIYVKFTKTTHQIWSCHVTLVWNSENFYFSPNSVLNFRKSYQIWGKLAQEQKSCRQRTNWGVENTPPPQCYRVKHCFPHYSYAT